MITSTKKTRRSEQREMMLSYLRGTKEHPSAHMIYNALYSENPTLSPATVYNNLKYFEEQGMVIRVANVNGVERYDANTEDHVHFVCKKCGAVIDVMDADVQSAKNACRVGQAEIDNIQIVLHGTCERCSDNI